MARFTFVYLAALLTLTVDGFAQGKNFVDQPYVEVTGGADSLVMPNLIYLDITISENDGKNKIDVEELEEKNVTNIEGAGYRSGEKGYRQRFAEQFQRVLA